MDDNQYPALRIAGRFVAIEKSLELLSEYVPLIQNQAQRRARASIPNKPVGWSQVDIDEWNDETNWVTEALIPRFFLGSFILQLAAAFETARKDIANYVEVTTQHPKPVRGDMAARSDFERYLHEALSSPLDIPPDVSQRLDDIQCVRNFLAHSNGDLRAERSSDRKARIVALAQENCGIRIHESELVFEERFLQESFLCVERYLNATIAYAVHREPHS